MRYSWNGACEAGKFSFWFVSKILIFQFQEKRTSCPNNQFLCDNGEQCIPHTWICDHAPDCLDGSDEANCGKDWISCKICARIHVMMFGKNHYRMKYWKSSDPIIILNLTSISLGWSKRFMFRVEIIFSSFLFWTY